MSTQHHWFYFTATILGIGLLLGVAERASAQQKQPNIVIIWGDDIGQSNISAYSMGLMGYRTPNIDSIAKAGMIFTDYYAEQSCTAGRASFLTGQHGLRTGLTKVGLPGAGELVMIPVQLALGIDPLQVKLPVAGVVAMQDEHGVITFAECRHIAFNVSG